MLSVLAICVGASVGALARWGLGVWLSQPGSLMLWGTLPSHTGATTSAGVITRQEAQILEKSVT